MKADRGKGCRVHVVVLILVVLLFLQMMEDANLVNLVNGRHTPISGRMC